MPDIGDIIDLNETEETEKDSLVGTVINLNESEELTSEDQLNLHLRSLDFDRDRFFQTLTNQTFKAGDGDSEKRAKRFMKMYLADKAGDNPYTIDDTKFSTYSKQYFGTEVNPVQLAATVQRIHSDLPLSDDLVIRYEQTKDPIDRYNQRHLAYRKGILKNINDEESFKKYLEMSSPQGIIRESRKVMSDEGEKFAMSSLMTRDFNLTEFKLLPKKDQIVMKNYLYAVNPEIETKWGAEAIQRLIQGTKNIGGAFKATFEETVRSITAPSDPEVMYQLLRKKYGSDPTYIFNDQGQVREKFKSELERELKAKESQAAMQGMAGMGPGAVAPAPVDITYMDQIKELYESGKRIHDDKKMQRKYDRLVQRKIKEEGFLFDNTLNAIEVGMDLAGAMFAGAATTAMGLGPTGAVVYSYGRFQGDYAQTLIYDHNVPAGDAFLISNAVAIPYVATEFFQVGQLKALLTGGKQTALKEGLRKTFKQVITDGVKKTGKNYLQETSEESLQSAFEKAGRLYAKEFAEAEGITYKGEFEDWYNESFEAAKTMIFISGPGGAIDTGREMRKSAKAGGPHDVDLANARLKKAELELIRKVKREVGLNEKDIQMDQLPKSTFEDIFSNIQDEIESKIEKKTGDYDTNFAEALDQTFQSSKINWISELDQAGIDVSNMSNDAAKTLLYNQFRKRQSLDAKQSDLAQQWQQEVSSLESKPVEIKTIRDIIKNLGLDPKGIKVVKSMYQVPDEARGSVSEDSRSKGLFDPKSGLTYIIADNIKKNSDIAKVVIEEEIGHKGFLEVLGEKNVQNFVNDITADETLMEQVQRVAAKRGLDMEVPSDVTTAVLEMVADRNARVRIPASKMKKIYNSVKEIFRKLFNISYTDEDINRMIGIAQSKIIGSEQNIKDYIRNININTLKGFDKRINEILNDPKLEPETKKKIVIEITKLNTSPIDSPITLTPRDVVEGIQTIKNEMTETKQAPEALRKSLEVVVNQINEKLKTKKVKESDVDKLTEGVGKIIEKKLSKVDISELEPLGDFIKANRGDLKLEKDDIIKTISLLKLVAEEKGFSNDEMKLLKYNFDKGFISEEDWQRAKDFRAKIIKGVLPAIFSHVKARQEVGTRMEEMSELMTGPESDLAADIESKEVLSKEQLDLYEVLKDAFPDINITPDIGVDEFFEATRDRLEELGFSEEEMVVTPEMVDQMTDQPFPDDSRDAVSELFNSMLNEYFSQKYKEKAEAEFPTLMSMIAQQIPRVDKLPQILANAIEDIGTDKPNVMSQKFEEFETQPVDKTMRFRGEEARTLIAEMQRIAAMTDEAFRLEQTRKFIDSLDTLEAHSNVTNNPDRNIPYEIAVAIRDGKSVEELTQKYGEVMTTKGQFILNEAMNSEGTNNPSIGAIERAEINSYYSDKIQNAVREIDVIDPTELLSEIEKMKSDISKAAKRSTERIEIVRRTRKKIESINLKDTNVKEKIDSIVDEIDVEINGTRSTKESRATFAKTLKSIANDIIAETYVHTQDSQRKRAAKLLNEPTRKEAVKKAKNLLNKITADKTIIDNTKIKRVQQDGVIKVDLAKDALSNAIHEAKKAEQDQDPDAKEKRTKVKKAEADVKETKAEVAKEETKAFSNQGKVEVSTEDLSPLGKLKINRAERLFNKNIELKEIDKNFGKDIEKKVEELEDEIKDSGGDQELSAEELAKRAKDLYNKFREKIDATDNEINKIWSKLNPNNFEEKKDEIISELSEKYKNRAAYEEILNGNRNWKQIAHTARIEEAVFIEYVNQMVKSFEDLKGIKEKIKKKEISLYGYEQRLRKGISNFFYKFSPFNYRFKRPWLYASDGTKAYHEKVADLIERYNADWTRAKRADGKVLYNKQLKMLGDKDKFEKEMDKLERLNPDLAKFSKNGEPISASQALGILINTQNLEKFINEEDEIVINEEVQPILTKRWNQREELELALNKALGGGETDEQIKMGKEQTNKHIEMVKETWEELTEEYIFSNALPLNVGYRYDVHQKTKNLSGIREPVFKEQIIDKDTDIREDGIYTQLINRLQELRHWEAFHKNGKATPLMMELNPIVEDQFRQTFGKDFSDIYFDRINDVLAGKHLKAGAQSQAIDNIRAIFASLSIGYNWTSVLRQMLGRVGLWLENGIFSYDLKKELEKSDDFNILREIFIKGPELAERRNQGFSEDMENNIRFAKQRQQRQGLLGKASRLYRKYSDIGFNFTSFGDALASKGGGNVFAYSYLRRLNDIKEAAHALESWRGNKEIEERVREVQELVKDNKDIKEISERAPIAGLETMLAYAKEKGAKYLTGKLESLKERVKHTAEYEAARQARGDAIGTVERTGQSAQVKDVSDWIAKGGSGLKSLQQFASSPIQILSIYVEQFHAARAALEKKLKKQIFRLDPRIVLTTKEGRKFLSTMLITHLVFPILNSSIDMLRQLIRGEEGEEEDVILTLIKMTSGPSDGVPIVNNIIESTIKGVTGEGDRFEDTGIPSFGIFKKIERVLNNSIKAVAGDEDQNRIESLGKLLKELNAITREIFYMSENWAEGDTPDEAWNKTIENMEEIFHSLID